MRMGIQYLIPFTTTVSIQHEVATWLVQEVAQGPLPM